MKGAVDIPLLQMIFCGFFVLLCGIASFMLKLRLGKDILWGSIRTIAQLSLMGAVLTFIFKINNPFLILLLLTWMIFWAAHTVKGRVESKLISLFPPLFFTMLFSYMLITFFTTAVVVQAKPWYNPQYFIPLGGMVIGNSMNALAVALERLFNDLRTKRNFVETSLSMGADYKEATAEIFTDSVRAGMIPSINSLMAVGLVFLPGMMTGQIISGVEPTVAVKYQIVIMFMVAGSTALGTVLVLSVIRKMCFTEKAQLKNI